MFKGKGKGKETPAKAMNRQQAEGKPRVARLHMEKCSRSLVEKVETKAKIILLLLPAH